MTQLLLDLQPTQAPSLDNFIVGENQELLARLRTLAVSGCFDALYLWGPEGCGKSHLLTAVATLAMRRRPALLLANAPAAADFTAPPGGLLIVDDVDTLDDAAQIALFRIFNTARMLGLGLLLAGTSPPLQLQLREDLRTRIGQALIYEIRTLNDEQKATALLRHAWERGLRVENGLVRYLLSHGRRDLPSLMAVLDHLDRTTLERQRHATLPLLKEAMQLQLVADNEPGAPEHRQDKLDDK
ncbi:MAG: DnaA regulatory inactivator Hda [Gammaproteobacteria bacterium]|nr:DnaA regulatory inactivator Hda [Rhodocyclaceae bacterium]MBU3907609.1 DnaA regulatory inactivator Hda [Gammaproteobacteria bacterium]MBU3990903.1 DnaA regulatory inactivator Hda [Gammaproteobacteria bacterium]MBU4004255.1 DnaA regulatory inactivator Hda [Gammaproteobacteria bacterium]MBU4019664.1 DnaA regulatory inactivator Hda [Gammaproteobacteria bacterium]